MPPGSISGPPKIRKSLPNRTFEHRSALRPSKNALREGVRKKHEHLMKNQCKNECVEWLRTTFGVILFPYNTLSPFLKKNQQIYAKRYPQSRAFCSKSEPWALQDRLILPFWSISGRWKNHRFFDFFKNCESVK